MTASQGSNKNTLQVYKLSYVNFINLLQPSFHHDSIAANRLDNLKGLLVKSIQFAD